MSALAADENADMGPRPDVVGTPRTRRFDPTTSWLHLEEETVATLLLSAVGEVLGLESENMPMGESFMNLGGTDEAAIALKKACMDLGLTVRTKDILQCPTLAELEKRVSTTSTSARSRQSSRGDMDIEPMRAISADAQNAHSRPSSRSSTSTRVQFVNELEELLSGEKLVRNVATIRPKAGILDRKFVVLLSLANSPPSQTQPDNFGLVPPSQSFFAGTQLASLRAKVESTLPADSVPEVWVPLDWMPLDAGGHVDRRRLRTWLQNMNDATYRRVLALGVKESPRAPTTKTELVVQRIAAKVLHMPLEQVGVNFALGPLGADDMLAMEFVALCKHESVFLTASEVLGSSTLADLAMVAASRGGVAPGLEEGTPDSFHLSPMQRLYFRTTMGGDLAARASHDGSYRFNQSLLLLCKRHCTVEDISMAIQTLVRHHFILRARFCHGGGTWTRTILPTVEGSYSFNQHSVSSDHEVEGVIARTQARLNVEAGPVFSVDYLSTHDARQMLYLAAHHLVVDLPSWRVMIYDLDELLANRCLLSPRSTTFGKWTDFQRAKLDMLAPPDVPALELQASKHAYWGLENVTNHHGDALEVTFSLTADLTALLNTTCNQVFRTDSVDIYLAALMLSFAQTFHDRPVPDVWVQEHGRDHWNPEVDIAEMVGWLTTLCPVSQKIENTADFVHVLRRLKDHRRSVPDRGAPFLARLFNGQEHGAVTEDCPFEITFSHAGSLQHLERDNGVLEPLVMPGRTLASPTSDIGPKVGRMALFEITAMVDDGVAKVKMLYHRHTRHQPRISAWMRNFDQVLVDAIGQLQHHPRELTLADVPHLDVTYEGLDLFNKQRVAVLNRTSVRDIDAIYPVTAVEQSILVSQVQRTETCFLHAIYEFASPTGDPIDVARICTAWESVTLRHTALRTVFTESVSESGLFDKVILRRTSPDMLFIDTPSGEDPLDELNKLPNLRSTDGKPNHRLSVSTSSAKTLVKLDISTALCDSISIHLLMADLRRAYVANKTISDCVPFPFPTYLRYLKEARGESTYEYWKDRLQGVQPCLFPRLTTQPGVQQMMANASLELDMAAQELADFVRAQRTSIGALLRLAWGLMLRAFTGSNVVCFGYQTIGRECAIEDIRHTVGSFANVVTCNYDLLPSKSLNSTFASVEEQLTESLRYQHATVEEIQHALGMSGGKRLFNSCLTFTEEPADLNGKVATRADLEANLEVRSVSHQQTFDMDVAVNTRFFKGKLAVDVSQRVMSPDQALGVAHTFGRAISAIMASPEGSIGRTNLFTKHDHGQILRWGTGWSKKEVQTRVMIHDLVSRQATSQPDTQAVCAWDGDFSYKQLDDNATRLSHYLNDAGVGPHSVVPVVMDKGRLAPVAMLAVLKTGAAFVPLDAEELTLIQPIFDCLNSRVAVASDQAALVLGNLFDRVVVFDENLLRQLPGDFHQRRSMLSIMSPDDTACLLFTPAAKEVKGTSFSHTALAATFLHQGPAARITARSRVMQLSSFSVDIAVAEIFTTLVHGGCLCVPSSAERVTGFTECANSMRVNWSYMTPRLSRKLDTTQLETVETVCFRTLSLDEETYNIWHGKATVMLAYGAGVSPLGISFAEVSGTHRLTTIGRPVAGNLWIINPDDGRNLVPVGALGELVIEGPMLGWPYPPKELGCQDEGLEVGGKKKTGCFKTGHRVRYTESGLIDFVSGQREHLHLDGNVVDLAEIELHVRRCLGQGVDVVVEAISFRREQVPVLAAFLELGDTLCDGEEDLTKLSATTRERVYMAKQLVKMGVKNTLAPSLVPSIFIPLKTLPLRSSLQVDRGRLQTLLHSLSKEELLALGEAPKPQDDAQGVGLTPLPLTQAEDRMRCLWARLLGVEEQTISSSDSFFCAGGDEVLACQLVTLCRHEGINMTIADVMGGARLTELCRGMVTTEATDGPPSYEGAESPTPVPAPAVNPASMVNDAFIERVIAPKVGVHHQAIRDMAEASATQMRYIESGMLRGRADINYFTFHFRGSVKAQRLEEACQMLVTTHPILRTAFVPHNRRVFQAVVKPFRVEFKRHDSASWRLSRLEEKVIRRDQCTPVTFCAPMTKFTYLDAGKQSTLVMRLSKAQFDDLSIALLLKDLKRFYDATGDAPQRPSFCDFVRCAAVANGQGADEYWKTLLEGSTMSRFVAHAKPHLVSSRVKTLRRWIPVGSLSNLGITFETVLKAAWAIVLASLSASSDVVFGELIDGRHVRLSGGRSVAGVMGPTINTIPVRVRFPESTLTPLALLQYVQAQRIAGLRYENLGFLHLVERCTQWPYWTRCSTVVQHQYEDTALKPGEPKTFHLGTATCRFTLVEAKAQDVPDMLVQSMLRGTSKAVLSVTYDADRVPLAMAEQALRMLCGAVTMLTSVSIIQPLVPAGYSYRALGKTIPMAPASHRATMIPVAPGLARKASPGSASSMLPRDKTRAIRDVVETAWTNLLDPLALGVPQDQLPHAAFYDLWGSLITAAQLAAYLNREVPKLGLPGTDAGLEITMEEVVNNPTMNTQFALIVGKLKTRDGSASEAAPMDPNEAARQQAQEEDGSKTRKKAGVGNLVASSTLGKRLRRFTSSVARASPAKHPAGAPLGMVSTPTRPSMARCGRASPNVGRNSHNPGRNRPKPVRTSPVPGRNSPVGGHQAPQLRNLSVFAAITEEPEEEEEEEKEKVSRPKKPGAQGVRLDGDGPTAAAPKRGRSTVKRSTGDLSAASGAAITLSSSSGGSTNGTADDDDDDEEGNNARDATPASLQRQQQCRESTPPTVPTTPEMSGEEERVISPLSARGGNNSLGLFL